MPVDSLRLAALRTIPLDPATGEEILALDPEHITEKGVREILLRTADVWHSVKKYGCFVAQVLIRAKRAMLGDH